MAAKNKKIKFNSPIAISYGTHHRTHTRHSARFLPQRSAQCAEKTHSVPDLPPPRNNDRLYSTRDQHQLPHRSEGTAHTASIRCTFDSTMSHHIPCSALRELQCRARFNHRVMLRTIAVAAHHVVTFPCSTSVGLHASLAGAFAAVVLHAVEVVFVGLPGGVGAGKREDE